jgi:hypothetical protein
MLHLLVSDISDPALRIKDFPFNKFDRKSPVGAQLSERFRIIDQGSDCFLVFIKSLKISIFVQQEDFAVL